MGLTEDLLLGRQALICMYVYHMMKIFFRPYCIFVCMVHPGESLYTLIISIAINACYLCIRLRYFRVTGTVIKHTSICKKYVA